MKTFPRLLISLFLFSIFLTILFSCNKRPESIGLDLVNSNRLGVGYDTLLTVSGYSSIDDSVVTNETSLNLVGSMYSDVFGLTNASFYAHLRLNAISPSFGSSPHGDSAFLTLVYSGKYGNTNTPLNVKVYEVTEDFYNNDTTKYFSNTNLSYSTLFADYTFVPNLSDSVVIDTVKYAPELKIPLNSDFMNKILQAYTIDSNYLASNDYFLQYLKGIYVKTESVMAPGEGSILYFNLLNLRSKVTLYYNDSSAFDLVFNNSSARIGKFEHDYSLSNDQTFKNQVLNKDTLLGKEKLYLQALAGVKTTLKFPELESWINSDNKFVINEVKLILPAYGTTEDLPAPGKLILFELNSDGNLVIGPDQQEGDNYFGGSYDESTQSYQFRISFYIQQLLNGAPDYGLAFYVSAKTINGSELKLFGTDQSLPQRVKLQIIYTKID